MFVESPSCDGGISEILSMTDPWCLILMTELRSAPYNLVQGDIVKAIVQAKNVNGWGPLSEPNTIGAEI
jgi:hypothetical protein